MHKLNYFVVYLLLLFLCCCRYKQILPKALVPDRDVMSCNQVLPSLYNTLKRRLHNVVSLSTSHTQMFTKWWLKKVSLSTSHATQLVTKWWLRNAVSLSTSHTQMFIKWWLWNVVRCRPVMQPIWPRSDDCRMLLVVAEIQRWSQSDDSAGRVTWWAVTQHSVFRTVSYLCSYLCN